MSTETITLFASDGSVQTDPELDPNLEGVLRGLYRKVKDSPKFPMSCNDISLLLAGQEFGFEFGWFYTDKPSETDKVMERFHPHSWATMGRINYDLVLKQFSSKLFQPVPEGIIIVEQGSALYNRYINKHSPLVSQLGLDLMLKF